MKDHSSPRLVRQDTWCEPAIYYHHGPTLWSILGVRDHASLKTDRHEVSFSVWDGRSDIRPSLRLGNDHLTSYKENLVVPHRAIDTDMERLQLLGQVINGQRVAMTQQRLTNEDDRHIVAVVVGTVKHIEAMHWRSGIWKKERQ